MKKFVILIPFILTGCLATIPITDNMRMSENGSFIEEVTFDWETNKNINDLVLCVRKDMPVLADVQTQDVIRAIDTKNKTIVGDGSFIATKYDPFLKSGNVKFKFSISENGKMTKISFSEIYSTFPTEKYTKLQPYPELLGDEIYNNLRNTAQKIQFCK